MVDYIKPPNQVFETVGMVSLFSEFLKDNYGRHSSEDFKRYVGELPNAELWCKNCGTVYDIESFGKVLDIQWELKENKKPGSMRITRVGHDAYSNTKQAGIVCSNSSCAEYKLPLDYLFVGNTKTLALAELEMVVLGNKNEKITDFAKSKDIPNERIFYSTGYSEAIGCRNDSSVLEFLVKGGFVDSMNAEIDKSRVLTYRLTDDGTKQLKKIKKRMFDEYSVWTQFIEFLNERLENRVLKHAELHEEQGLKTKWVFKNSEIIEDSKYSKPKLIVHVPDKKVRKVWKDDHKKHWSGKNG